MGTGCSYSSECNIGGKRSVSGVSFAWLAGILLSLSISGYSTTGGLTGGGFTAGCVAGAPVFSAAHPLSRKSPIIVNIATGSNFIRIISPLLHFWGSQAIYLYPGVSGQIGRAHV